MSNANITVEVKDVYGSQLVYPVCEKAKLFAQMAGSKTLTQKTLGLIEQLGFIINVQQATVSIKTLQNLRG